MFQGLYLWNDGTKADYFKWYRPTNNANYQPNGAAKEHQDCIKMEADNRLGYFNDVECNKDDIDFICERLPTCG